MEVKAFYDKDTYTLSYVVYNKGQDEALIIDPVWDFDPASGKLSTNSINRIESFLAANGLRPVLSIETHAHADHLSGSQQIKKRFPEMQVAISERITAVQDLFAPAFNLKNLSREGQTFDRLLKDNEVVEAAGLKIKVLPTPGHTPACSSLLIGETVFTGDALFMPDYGTGRCDFPAGSAESLYKSVQQTLYALPDATKVYVGHDYQPNGRQLEFMTTIGESKAKNIQINTATAKADFVEFRQGRDKTLAAPRLLYPSVQVNIRAGNLPDPEDNGQIYLKIPAKP